MPKIVSGIPKVLIRVLKPAILPFCFNNKGKLWNILLYISLLILSGILGSLEADTIFSIR